MNEANVNIGFSIQNAILITLAIIIITFILTVVRMLKDKDKLYLPMDTTRLFILLLLFLALLFIYLGYFLQVFMFGSASIFVFIGYLIFLKVKGI